MNATPKPIEAASTGLPTSSTFGPHLFEVSSQSRHSPAVAHYQGRNGMTDQGVAPAPALNPASATHVRMQATLGAFNASNLASSYIERGNFSAARRKLMLALQAINEIQTKG